MWKVKDFVAKFRKSTVYKQRIEAAELLIQAVKLGLEVVSREEDILKKKTEEYNASVNTRLAGIARYQPDPTDYILLFKQHYSEVYKSLLDEESIAYAKLKRIYKSSLFESFEEVIKKDNREGQARKFLIRKLEDIISSAKVELQIEREEEGSDLALIYKLTKRVVCKFLAGFINIVKGFADYIRELPPPQFYTLIALIAFIYAPNFVNSLAQILK